MLVESPIVTCTVAALRVGGLANGRAINITRGRFFALLPCWTLECVAVTETRSTGLHSRWLVDLWLHQFCSNYCSISNWLIKLAVAKSLANNSACAFNEHLLKQRLRGLPPGWSLSEWVTVGAIVLVASSAPQGDHHRTRRPRSLTPTWDDQCFDLSSRRILRVHFDLQGRRSNQRQMLAST